MSEIDTGGPAFPTGTAFQGMTLRDYFAAKAMQTIMSPSPVTGQYPQPNEFEGCAVGAYQMADAMLKAREY